jgi:two-component system, LuxR family, response regulator FixJ
MSAEEATVFVVDDDRDMRESLKWLLESVGIRVAMYESAEHFLERPGTSRPGCMLVDVRMPGMGGLRLLELLRDDGSNLPVILFTGHGDIPMAVKALKCGAFDFIEKPATHQQILERVQQALTVNGKHRAKESERGAMQYLLAQLSEREKEVLDHLVKGDSNKVMAMELGISERTIEKHRESLMQKMGTRSLAALIRMVVLHHRDTIIHDGQYVESPIDVDHE